MTNRQLIKSAHIVALMLLLACGVLVVAGKARSTMRNQNSNQNGNTNTGDTTKPQNENTKKSGNRNSRDMGAKGSQAGMGSLNSQDSKFLMDAAMGGLMEVELGRVATQQASSAAVKQFGQRMVDDHSAANTELTSLATSKGVTLPTALDEKNQEHVTKMSAMSGADFDRAYMKMMVSDHNKDVSEFEKESTKGTDPDLKAFASKTLPTLQEHLQMAKSAESSVGGGNSNRSAGNSNSNNRKSNSNSNSNSNRP